MVCVVSKKSNGEKGGHELVVSVLVAASRDWS